MKISRFILVMLICNCFTGCNLSENGSVENSSKITTSSTESNKTVTVIADSEEEISVETVKSSEVSETTSESSKPIVNAYRVISNSVYPESDIIIMQVRAMRINIGDIIEFPMTSCPAGKLVFKNEADCVQLSIGADGRTHIAAVEEGAALVSVTTEDGQTEVVSIEVLK